MNRFVRSLVLVCSLPLALPQGWCCILLTWTMAAAAESPVAGACSCCQTTSDPTPAEEKEPAPVPAKSICSCVERTAVLNETKPIHFNDIGFVAILPASVSVLHLDGHLDSVAVRQSVLPVSSLHILHCVWLC